MSVESTKVLLEHYLKTLKLPSILREHRKMAAVCQAEGADYSTYLLRLVEQEIHDREQRAAERRLKSACFPVVKTLDSFRFEAQPSINQPLVRELAHGEFIKERENVLLIGNSGTGKTHLATALAFAACQMGFRVRFFGVTGLVTQLLERRDERQLERFFKQLERVDLLVLDELGYVPFSKMGAELLFEVVSRAYERTSLVVTTNPALRVVDGGDGFAAAHRRFIGSADPPGPYPRGQRGKLPAQGLHAPPKAASGREEIVEEIDTRKDAG